MKIYFDNCGLQRPFDDRSQPRIEREADAIVEVLSLCESGNLELISSETLEFEIGLITDTERKEASLEILKIARETIFITTELEKRALEFAVYGIKALDALHLASAEAENADYFCTTDDKFLKKARTVSGLKMKTVSPIDLLEEALK